MYVWHVTTVSSIGWKSGSHGDDGIRHVMDTWWVPTSNGDCSSGNWEIENVRVGGKVWSYVELWNGVYSRLDIEHLDSGRTFMSTEVLVEYIYIYNIPTRRATWFANSEYRSFLIISDCFELSGIPPTVVST